MKKLKRTIVLIISMLCSIMAWSQGDGKVEMADTMRSNGRIYVVVAVMLTILVGLILYLIRLDKKVSKMEKEK